jgi:uncharacterized protein YndB with AHSA1/START domain
VSEVRIERTFAASAEQLFDAWTSPEVMARWLRCEADWGTSVAEVDLRIGGTIRVVMRKPDGTESEMAGEFTVIDRPHRLEMTWTFFDDPGNLQLMELAFTELEPGRTRAVLVNSRIASDQRRSSQEWGWRGCLDQLEQLLAQ